MFYYSQVADYICSILIQPDMEPTKEKRRSGRKKLPEGQKIRQQFIYTTDPQFAALASMADLKHQTVSQFILNHFNLS